MRLRIFALASLTCLAATSALSDPIDPAQAIAQKFYEADQATRPESVAKPDDQPARPTPVAKPDAPPGFDYEMEMLASARAEEEERQKEDAQKVLATKVLTTIAQPVPVAATQPAPIAAIQPGAVAVPEASPEPEPYMAQPADVVRPPVAPPVQLAIAQTKEPTRPPTTNARATVRIVLDTDDSRKAYVKPDPIICFDQQCWISNGLEAPAKPMPRSEAVALKTTDSATGDSCSGKSGCAFRDVAFDPTTQVQVVEVGESRGVADGAYTVAADTSCRKHEGSLRCNNALVTHAFRMWIVPEATAQAMGPTALEDAVADGLQDDGEDMLDGK
jgi:hypothetical protein